MDRRYKFYLDKIEKAKNNGELVGGVITALIVTLIITAYKEERGGD